MTRVRAGLLCIVLVACGVRPVYADVTAFIGANTTPTNHQVRGFAVGIGIILAIEFEFADSTENAEAGAPALRTGMGSVLIQPPLAVRGLQPYATLGVGLYRETLEGHQATGIALNSGAGLKVGLAGPLQLRMDYRIFRLRNDALHSPAHRVYVGLNLRF